MGQGNGGQEEATHSDKKFPALASLEDNAMGIMSDFVKTPRKNRYGVLIVDRISKLVRTDPQANINVYDVAPAFTTHWIFTCRPPVPVLTGNCSKFAYKFMLETYRILGVKELFATTYRPETNGQTEIMKKTIC